MGVGFWLAAPSAHTDRVPRRRASHWQQPRAFWPSQRFEKPNPGAAVPQQPTVPPARGAHRRRHWGLQPGYTPAAEYSQAWCAARSLGRCGHGTYCHSVLGFSGSMSQRRAQLRLGAASKAEWIFTAGTVFVNALRPVLGLKHALACVVCCPLSVAPEKACHRTSVRQARRGLSELAIAPSGMLYPVLITRHVVEMHACGRAASSEATRCHLNAGASAKLPTCSRGQAGRRAGTPRHYCMPGRCCQRDGARPKVEDGRPSLELSFLSGCFRRSRARQRACDRRVVLPCEPAALLFAQGGARVTSRR